MSTLLALLMAQTLVGKAGDPLMRPGIPDGFLVRQDWVQRDVGMTSEEVRRVQAEIQLGMPRPNRLRVDSRDIRHELALAMTKKHEKRIRELSIWQADVLAFSNEWIQAQTGLAPATRKRVDDSCRAFFSWWQAETERLNRTPVKTGELSKTLLSRQLSPDPIVTLKKLVALRKDLRKLIPPSAHAKLKSLRGAAPHTYHPFGFPRLGPSVFVPPTQSLLMNPRVHEELGFSMRQSRLTLEGLRNSKDLPQSIERVRDGLTSQQRKRLDQLELQAMGTRALLYHDLLQRLEVDPNRLDDAYLEITILTRQAHEIQQDEQAAYAQLASSKTRDAATLRGMERQIQARYTALRQSIEQRIDATLLAMLDKQQRKRLQTLLGPPLPGVKLRAY